MDSLTVCKSDELLASESQLKIPMRFKNMQKIHEELQEIYAAAQSENSGGEHYWPSTSLGDYVAEVYDDGTVYIEALASPTNMMFDASDMTEKQFVSLVRDFFDHCERP